MNSSSSSSSTPSSSSSTPSSSSSTPSSSSSKPSSSSSTPSSSSSKPSSSQPSSSGAGGNDPVASTFKATYYNGSSYFDSKTCTTSVGGSTCVMSIPSGEPVKSGYTFAGWGSSDGCTSGSLSAFTVSSNVSRYACWTKNSTVEPSDDSEPSSEPSSNVDENPQTGQIAMFIVWVVALAAIVYSVWYFKKVRESK